MDVLIIDGEAKLKLQALIAHAEKNVFSMDDLLDVHNKDMLCAGDLGSDFSCEIPRGYKVVFSLEDQPAGRVRHLSVSVNRPGLCPSPQAVQAIMEEIGFQHNILQCQVKLEKVNKQTHAVNVWEVIE
jgi:hypothetical protein